MSIAELGSLGELIGAVAVVLTLIFLTLQMRQNTKAIRASMAADLTTHFMENTHSIINDPRMSEPMYKSMTGDAEGLSEKDQFLLFWWGMASLKAGDFAHYQWVNGNLDDDLWQGTAQTLARSFGNPIHPFSLAWEGTRQFCTPQFQRYIESIREAGGRSATVGSPNGRG